MKSVCKGKTKSSNLFSHVLPLRQWQLMTQSLIFTFRSIWQNHYIAQCFISLDGWVSILDTGSPQGMSHLKSRQCVDLLKSLRGGGGDAPPSPHTLLCHPIHLTDHYPHLFQIQYWLIQSLNLSLHVIKRSCSCPSQLQLVKAILHGTWPFPFHTETKAQGDWKHRKEEDA